MTWTNPDATKRELEALDLIARDDLITPAMIADTLADPRTHEQPRVVMTVPPKPKTKRSKHSPGQPNFLEEDLYGSGINER